MPEILRRTTMLTTYGKSENGQGVPLEHGMGLFFKHEDRSFVVTNAHVIHRFAQMRKNREEVRLQVVIKNGSQGPEVHSRYLLLPLEYSADGKVRDTDHHIDIGLIELTVDSVKEAEGSKIFVDASQIDTSLPETGDPVIYRGYPEDNVFFDPNFRDAEAMGETHFTKVTRAHSNLIVMDNQDSDRKRKGVSGAGLFDEKMKLRGIVWGGCNERKEVYACPASHILPAIERYILGQHPSDTAGPALEETA